MKYITEDDLRQIGIPWASLSDVIAEVSLAYGEGDYAQPIKPYLKFGDASNRIIAMPAYISRPIRAAGMKWIASYPENVNKGLPRANSVTILNDPDTGIPNYIVNGSLISTIRTTAVSAALLRKLLQERKGDDLQVAVIGMGPIGQHHVNMLTSLFSERIAEIRVYDKREISFSLPIVNDVPVKAVATWQEAYLNADIVFTCTASSARYIHIPSKEGSILMHVSLRDYLPEAKASSGLVVVDSWDEICRADTDIERLHLDEGLQEEHTVTLSEVIAGKVEIDASWNERIWFTPMGLAVFDVAVAAWYTRQADELGIGLQLD
ncbi:2,3-diaminopropionate biosynthesis protein SbnB [Paenibacillus agilis]|uniref:2,3-diaminopropionate biosynthesis protein SbnB n=1 Tax=Paenibacillus agilis TaxID=3020863 RepID=A0A559IL05_9BACL|nr:2,3-diaminopropionate biosynthesis protein SbnB [Paenibacillus agilis]TVX88297.1 2,3-diaminopropionate biosynthesis protein SbnB [Paenibacillus agilis]